MASINNKYEKYACYDSQLVNYERHFDGLHNFVIISLHLYYLHW